MGSKKGISGEEVQYNAEISRRVEFFRRVKGVANRELAEAAGVSPNMLIHYQAGESRWPAFRLRLIADFFQVSVGHILPKRKTCVDSSCEAQRNA